MADFTVKIGGHTAAVASLFDSTRDYCRDYWSEEAPEFSVSVTEADLSHEQYLLDEEAKEEGFRQRNFTAPFLDRAAVQRKIADRLLSCSVLMTHGSAIAADGQGYLFTAKSGTGKSTHTRLWREVLGSCAVTVNDDKPFISLEQGEILLCGAPWSGKHGLHSNIAVPLRGICILERGSENTIAPILAEDALPMLLHQTHCPPGREAEVLKLLHTLAERIPLWRMQCTKSLAAARLAYAAMSKPEKDA